MPRFFTKVALTQAQIQILGGSNVEILDVGGLRRFVLGAGSMDAAFIAARNMGVEIFHDAVIASPPAASGCKCERSDGHALQARLAATRPLDGADGLIIVVDTGLDAATLEHYGIALEPAVTGPYTKKNGPTAHGTMCAVDAIMGAPLATVADLSIDAGPATFATDLMAGLQSLEKDASKIEKYRSWIVCMALHLAEANFDLALPDDVRVTLNDAHPLWQALSSLSRAGFDVLCAAGNEGCNGGEIKGLALHPDVITVGAVDHRDVADPGTSKGPETSMKPDVSAYTNFIWSLPPLPDTGTSAATGLACGLIASARGARADGDRTALTPAALRGQLRNWVKIPALRADASEPHPELGWGIL